MAELFDLNAAASILSLDPAALQAADLVEARDKVTWAFRRAALTFHPDRHPKTPGAC